MHFWQRNIRFAVVNKSHPFYSNRILYSPNWTTSKQNPLLKILTLQVKKNNDGSRCNNFIINKQSTEMLTDLVLTSPAQLQTFISQSVRNELSNIHPTATPLPKHGVDIIYLTREQAAEVLHVSIPTLDKAIKDKKLKAYRIGNRVLIKKDEIHGSLKKI